MKKTVLFCAAVVLSLMVAPTWAAVLQYGDADALGFGSYGATDPKAGATLQGLVAGASTLASNSYGHGFPFSPSIGDYAGTDQIYVGKIQTYNHDGYSGAGSRLHGPQVISLDYSSLVSPSVNIDTFTLGIAADDFQRPSFGQPFSAMINGILNSGLTTVLNTFNQTGPRVQFFTFGINPTALASSNILTLSIDQGGDGGDGWAVDFLTTGVTTSPKTSAVPEPATLLGFGLPMLMVGLGKLRGLRKA